MRELNKLGDMDYVAVCDVYDKRRDNFAQGRISGTRARQPGTDADRQRERARRDEGEFPHGRMITDLLTPSDGAFGAHP